MRRRRILKVIQARRNALELWISPHLELDLFSVTDSRNKMLWTLADVSDAERT